MSDIQLDPAIDLAIAVLLQAVRDARNADWSKAVRARIWLAGTGHSWLESLGMDSEYVLRKLGEIPSIKGY